MPSRSAPATEAMIKRSIRAAQKCGLTVKAVVPRGDGVAIEIENGLALDVASEHSVLDDWRARRGSG